MRAMYAPSTRTSSSERQIHLVHACHVTAVLFALCMSATPDAAAGLIFWKPTTPGLRHKISLDYKALNVYDGPPDEQLSTRIRNTGGRNSTGRITVWCRGGGMKKVVRLVDYNRRQLDGVPGVVQRIEADPNRSGFLALVRYEPGEQWLGQVVALQVTQCSYMPNTSCCTGTHCVPATCDAMVVLACIISRARPAAGTQECTRST